MLKHFDMCYSFAMFAANMTAMANKLIKVGNSRAVIIPARILKELRIEDDASFTISCNDNGDITLRRERKRQPLVFPRIKLPDQLPDDILALNRADVHWTDDEIKNDPRLMYIFRHENIL